MKKLKKVFGNRIAIGQVKILFPCMLFVFIGCDDFLTSIDGPGDKIKNDIVFADDITATSAILGIYANLLSETNGFARGDNKSLLALSGLSADELDNFPDPGQNISFVEFEENNLSTTNIYGLSLWSSMYKTIYLANAAMEGLNSSTGVTLQTKRQLKGEALFIRAFSYFYLVNLFGDVPLALSTDYEETSVVSRQLESIIYEQIVFDLIEAQGLLAEEYSDSQGERIHPNKSAATALLARTYLYLEDWADAEIQASVVIAKTFMYDLPKDVNSVFLKNSQEAIWQLKPNFNPNSENGYTWEGFYFSASNVLGYNVLRREIVSSFEANDARRNNWVGSFSVGAQTVYHPLKYKSANYNAPLTEYAMIMRLAEQYLIRSEARARMNDLVGAISDLDHIRERAGIPLIQNINPGISQPDLLQAIEQERKVELFAEWGHRWLDLKRTDRAVPVLSLLKSGFNANDQLYPIPQSEFNSNPELGDQNPGY